MPEATFARILVPLDGSRLSESVLPVAETLATAFGASLVLLHVLERAAPQTIHGERHFQDPDKARAYLDDLAGNLTRRGLSVTVHIHDTPEPNVALSIAGHAIEERADLVVLCTHGRGGVRGFVWGAIAQQVLQRGEVPVLLVRAPAQGAEPAPFAPTTILVPLDATAAAEGEQGEQPAFLVGAETWEGVPVHADLERAKEADGQRKLGRG
jgi:nucleotide-binding universal stress UspA family protein